MAAIDRSTNRENFDAVAELIDQNVSHFDPLAGLFLWDFMYGMVSSFSPRHNNRKKLLKLV